MMAARSPVVRVLAPAPGAVTTPSRCTARRRRIITRIPARARYLFSVAIDVIPTLSSRLSEHGAMTNRVRGEHGATAQQNARPEPTYNREQHPSSIGKVLTHIRP